MSIHTNEFRDIIQKRGNKIMSLYQRIRDLREDEGLTQKEIANVLYDTQQHYQLYESGKREIPLCTAITLSKYYKVSLDYIAGLTNDKGGQHKNSKTETEILSKYNSLCDIRKGRVLQLLDMLKAEQEKEQESIK